MNLLLKKEKINNIQVVFHAVPSFINLGQSKSATVLLYLASCIQMITEEYDYHQIVAENGIIDIIMHIISNCIQQGRFLGSMKKEINTDFDIDTKFICCRKTLYLAVKALSVLSANDELKEFIAREYRLETLVKLCFSDEFIFNQGIHDLLVQSILELGQHGIFN